MAAPWLQRDGKTSMSPRGGRDSSRDAQTQERHQQPERCTNPAQHSALPKPPTQTTLTNVLCQPALLQPLTEDPILLPPCPLPLVSRAPAPLCDRPKEALCLGAPGAQQVSRACGAGASTNHRLCLSGDIWLRLGLRPALDDSQTQREKHTLLNKLL